MQQRARSTSLRRDVTPLSSPTCWCCPRSPCLYLSSKQRLLHKRRLFADHSWSSFRINVECGRWNGISIHSIPLYLATMIIGPLSLYLLSLPSPAMHHEKYRLNSHLQPITLKLLDGPPDNLQLVETIVGKHPSSVLSQPPLTHSQSLFPQQQLPTPSLHPTPYQQAFTPSPSLNPPSQTTPRLSPSTLPFPTSLLPRGTSWLALAPLPSPCPSRACLVPRGRG